MLAMIISLFLLPACAPWRSQGTTRKETHTPSSETMTTPVSRSIDLPKPKTKGALTLEEAIAKRRSVREFEPTPLTLEEISQLLWAAQGITHPGGYRSAPSAGALYPLEVYAVLAEGVYHYDPQAHRLNLQAQGDLRPALHAAALYQDSVLEAPAVFVIAAVYQRTAQKYGRERSPRYVHLEAGHASQNLLLQAVALDLGAVPIGAFYDDQVQEVLDLAGDQQPLYLIPVGHPRR